MEEVQRRCAPIQNRHSHGRSDEWLHRDGRVDRPSPLLLILHHLVILFSRLLVERVDQCLFVDLVLLAVILLLTITVRVGVSLAAQGLELSLAGGG
jgi:hypothetical protein